jgi:hypothetical protein
MSRPFTRHRLVADHLPFVARRVGVLISVIERTADKNETMELDETFMDLTMDVINQYLYGRSAEDELNYSIVGNKSNLKVCRILETG